MMSKNKKLTILSAALVSTVMLSGCGLFGGENGKENVDPPQSTTYSDNATEETAAKAGEETAESMPIELYLVDKDGFVVPQTLNIPKTNSVAKESLEYLVKDGPVTEMLPNGFQGVLPAGTEVTVNIKDKVATVDFSKEFNDYDASDESKIMQSVTWTLTQFDSIDSVKLQVNGKELVQMPVNKTPIQSALTREMGINLDTKDVADITNTKPLTVYYVGGETGEYYYVPVTKRVSNANDNNIAAAVGELAEGPGTGSALATFMEQDVKLLDEPVVADGKVTLNFNESIYNSADGEEKPFLLIC